MSQKTFIKICGITTLDDAKFAISSGVDAIGFISYPKSPRYISADSLKKICCGLSAEKVKKVGVFVNAGMETINEYLDAGIDTIQLHGDENADFAKECSKMTEVWKALKPKSHDDVLQYMEYPVQKFLLDAFHKTLPGGTGMMVDRELAKFAVTNLPAPLILAGGINPANFAEILTKVQPFGLDINSGVEKSPGIKDHRLIKKIFELVSNF